MSSEKPSVAVLPRTREGRGIVLSALAALVWPGQALFLAWMGAALLTDATNAPVVLAPIGFFVLSVLRTVIDSAAQRLLSEAVEQRIGTLRHEIVTTENMAAQPSALGGAGALAALATDKLEALRPWLLRYRPARVRAVVVPLVILALSLWHSWAVALVLLFAGPLVPLGRPRRQRAPDDGDWAIE